MKVIDHTIRKKTSYMFKSYIKFSCSLHYLLLTIRGVHRWTVYRLTGPEAFGPYRLFHQPKTYQVPLSSHVFFGIHLPLLFTKYQLKIARKAEIYLRRKFVFVSSRRNPPFLLLRMTRMWTFGQVRRAVSAISVKSKMDDVQRK